MITTACFKTKKHQRKQLSTINKYLYLIGKKKFLEKNFAKLFSDQG